jgi:hypothetical protein
VNIAFATQSNHNYTVSYASSLSAPVVWSNLTTLSGNGAIQTAADTVGSGTRYYRVLAQ